MILRFFSKKSLWKEILRREGFTSDIVDDINSVAVWQEVFSRVPLLKDWFRKREIALLKSLALQDKNKDIILGQIAEVRLYSKFDIPNKPEIKVVDDIEKNIKVISEKDFLEKW
jgi:hypothetical protein